MVRAHRDEHATAIAAGIHGIARGILSQGVWPHVKVLIVRSKTFLLRRDLQILRDSVAFAHFDLFLTLRSSSRPSSVKNTPAYFVFIAISLVSRFTLQGAPVQSYVRVTPSFSPAPSLLLISSVLDKKADRDGVNVDHVLGCHV